MRSTLKNVPMFIFAMSIFMVLFVLLAPLVKAQESVSTNDKQIVLTEMVIGKYMCKLDFIPSAVLDEINADIADDLGVSPKDSSEVIIIAAKSVWENSQRDNKTEQLCKVIKEKALNAFSSGA